MVAAQVEDDDPRTIDLQRVENLVQFARGGGRETADAGVTDLLDAGGVDELHAVHGRHGERQPDNDRGAIDGGGQFELLEPVERVPQRFGRAGEAGVRRAAVHLRDAVAATELRVKRRPRAGHHALNDQPVLRRAEVQAGRG